MNLLSKLGILAAACAIAFGAGLYTAHKFALASQVAAVKQEVKVTARAVQQSTAASQQIQTTVQSKDAAVANVKQAIDARLAQPRKPVVSTSTNHETAQAPVCDASNPVGDQPLPFDVDTVRLLNSARAGIVVSAAAGSHAEVASPASAAGGSPAQP
jgi:hypothetical protein